MRTLPDPIVHVDPVLDLTSLLQTHMHTLAELLERELEDDDEIADVMDQVDGMYDTMLEWQIEFDYSVAPVLIPVDPYHFERDDLVQLRHAYQSLLDTLI